MVSDHQSSDRLKHAIGAAEGATLLDTSLGLQEAARTWRSCQVVGLDTEFVRERTYRADLGLVQISDGRTAWLVDPVAIDDLTPLSEFLANDSIEKVIHSGSEDFEVMYHKLGTVAQNVVDSQIACAMLGQSLQLGYHHAARWLFDVEIEKDHTRSNWLRRPLSSGQLRYAALDVVLLPMMIEVLRGKLEALGRWDWLVEEVNRMEKKSIEDTDPGEAWMRISGAGALDDIERRILCSLASWRERTAVERNIARGFVIADAALMAMARVQPKDLSQLREIEGIHSKVVERHAETWLRLIRGADASPPVAPLPQLTQQQRKCLKSLRKEVADVAHSLNVDAALLASRKQLESLIFAFQQSGDVPDRFRGWRFEVITERLVKILQA